MIMKAFITFGFLIISSFANHGIKKNIQGTKCDPYPKSAELWKDIAIQVLAALPEEERIQRREELRSLENKIIKIAMSPDNALFRKEYDKLQKKMTEAWSNPFQDGGMKGSNLGYKQLLLVDDFLRRNELALGQKNVPIACPSGYQPFTSNKRDYFGVTAVPTLPFKEGPRMQSRAYGSYARDYGEARYFFMEKSAMSPELRHPCFDQSYGTAVPAVTYAATKPLATYLAIGFHHNNEINYGGVQTLLAVGWSKPISLEWKGKNIQIRGAEFRSKYDFKKRKILRPQPPDVDLTLSDAIVTDEKGNAFHIEDFLFSEAKAKCAASTLKEKINNNNNNFHSDKQKESVESPKKRIAR